MEFACLIGFENWQHTSQTDAGLVVHLPKTSSKLVE
jgi:hypothetical protein